MKKALLATCQSNDQEIELRQSFVAAVPLRRALSEVIEGKITEAHNAQIANSNYSNPNWAFKQADSAGYQRAMKEILNFLSEK